MSDGTSIDARAALRAKLAAIPSRPATPPRTVAATAPALSADLAGHDAVSDVTTAATFGQVARQLHENGYRPIPIRAGSKAPAIEKWTEYAFKPGDERTFADCGVGLLTGELVGVDLDVLDPDRVGELIARATKILGKSPFVRVGQKPKAMLLYRTAKPRTKCTTKPVQLPGTDKPSRVEILGLGQQLVAFGIHPTTGKPYEWQGGSPLTTALADLPEVTPAQLDAFVQAAEADLRGSETVDDDDDDGALTGPVPAILVGTAGDELTSTPPPSTAWYDELSEEERVVEARAMLAALPDSAADDRTEWINTLAEITSLPLQWETRVDLAFEFSGRGPESKRESRDGVERIMRKRGFGTRTNVNALAKRAAKHGYVQAASAPPAAPAVSTTPIRIGAGTPALSFEYAKNGAILPTPKNLVLALSSSAWIRQNIGYDCSKDETVIAPDGVNNRPLRDTDYLRLTIALMQKGFSGPISKELLRDAVNLVAESQQFDSAKDWLESRQWDGVPRVELFLSDYFGAADTPYPRAVSRTWWDGHAGRLLDPGCQFDTMIVLIGPQGCGKSSGVAAMVPHKDHYMEMDLTLHDTDQARLGRNKWIAEVPEMKGFAGRGSESNKAFITRRYEEWVPKYREFGTKLPRRYVIVGTTNKPEFLEDETGNRRYLPVGVSHVNVAAIERDRDLLWAEARERYRANGIEYADAERLARAEHGAYRVDDVWEAPIAHWLDSPGPGGKKWGDQRFSIADLLIHAVGKLTGQHTRADQMRAGRVLKHLGFESRNVKINGVVQRQWMRSSAISPPATAKPSGFVAPSNTTQQPASVEELVAELQRRGGVSS